MIRASKPFSWPSEWFKVKFSGLGPESGSGLGSRFSNCSSCSAIAVIACNKTFSSVIALSNDKGVVGGNFVVDVGVVGVKVDVGTSDSGLVSVEILRPQCEFIVGMFARVNSWTAFVAIVVSNASFKISNSSSV